jgi:hypothetical protein
MSISSRAAVMALGIALVSTHSAAGQASASEGRALELRVTSGAFVPTGNQRNAVANAQVTAAQLAWVLRPSLAVTGTFTWARSRDVGLVNTPKLDVFTSDVGLEARPTMWFARHAVSVSPFAGVGAGMRSYNYRKLDVDATNNLAGYASAGGELGIGRVGLRLEVRDYATGFRPLAGAGRSDMRNDVVMMAGIRFNRHRAPNN